MAKITPRNLKDLGFTADMYRLDESVFEVWLTALVSEQAAYLSARIGAVTYAVATSPTVDNVRLAEKHLCIAELWRRRIVCKLQPDTAGDISTAGEEKALKDALELAEVYIGASGSASSSGYSGAIVESEYFTTDLVTGINSAEDSDA